MRPFPLVGRTRAARVVLAALALSVPSLLIAFYAFGAAAPKAPPAPAPETLQYGDNEVVVHRTAKATAADLLLPFYPGAEVLQSFTWRVDSKEGKQLSYYAMALLTTKDAPEKVARTYSDQMPGKPKPETLKDKQGGRIVLAVTSGNEVRSVTITKVKAGSDIRLTRATQHGPALSLPKPEAAPQRPMRRGPGRRMGPGRMGPRRGTTRV